MQVNIRLLEQQHSAITSAIDELCALTDMPLDQGLPLVAKARLRLAKVVADNIATELTEIHTPLRSRNLARHIADYDKIEVRSRELRVTFSVHIAKWSLTAIEQDWHGYGRSLREITTELAHVVAWEERSLFPDAQRLLAGAEPAQ